VFCEILTGGLFSVIVPGWVKVLFRSQFQEGGQS
jgi:hypothetical protein